MLAIFCFIISLIPVVLSYPYKLQCERPMQPGSVIMGNAAKLYNVRSILVSRNGVPLQSGDQYIPGETLTVQVSTLTSATGLFKFMFQADKSATFTSGSIMCEGKRAYNLGDGTLGDSNLLMPATTSNTAVNIWGAWATQYGQVFITQNFTLINFPSTQQPSLSPDYTTVEPTLKPTKQPIVKAPTLDTSPKFHQLGGTQQDFTLVLKKVNIPDHFNKEMIMINGSVPGPTLRVKLGDWVNVKVINELGDEMTVFHWHGFDQKSTPWNDGPPGVTQCPINTYSNIATKTLLSSSNAVTQMNYRFHADRTGTYWYHGHYSLQYPEGLYGAIVVEDDDATLQAYQNVGVSYILETEIIISDFYRGSTAAMIPAFMSPQSHGFEPLPDEIVVNNMFSKTMQIPIDDINQKMRLRVVNGGSVSQFEVSIDGLPLQVIEIDGTPVKPQQFSFVRIDVGQRVSFIIDWSLIDPKFAGAANVPLKVRAVKEMYRQYDPSDTSAYGLIGSTSESRFYTTWVGQFTFGNDGVQNYYYYGASISTPSTAAAPLETNLLQMIPLFSNPVPPADLYMDYNITFSTDPIDGVAKYFMNGKTYVAPSVNSPQLFDYMMPNGGPLSEPNYPKYSTIPGDGANPFVLPFGRSITVTIRNADGMAHPMHMHGHNFWVLGTNLYTPSTPITRDTVSVPAGGWAKLRFMSDNPGVWLLHCHIDWHMVSGFMSTMVEAPSKLKNTIGNVPADHIAACPSYFAPTSKPSFVPSQAPMIGTYKPVIKPTTKPNTLSPTNSPVQQASNAGDWNTYGYDARRTGINPTSTGINKKTAKRFQKVWRYQLAGGAIMQPVVALNYEIGTSVPAKYARRGLMELEMLELESAHHELGSSSSSSSYAKLEDVIIYTPKPNPQPIMPPTIKWTGALPYESIGCYGDNTNRVMTLLGDAVSVADCYNTASFLNYNYFGIKEATTCWGSNDLVSSTSYGLCGTPGCTGLIPQCSCQQVCANGQNNCGDEWSISLYKVTAGTWAPTVAPTAPSLAPTKTAPQGAVSNFKPSVYPSLIPTSVRSSNYNYLGCYGDSAALRAFAVTYGTQNSIDDCFHLASTNGYSYFGLQYGGQCWVSSDLKSVTQFNQCGASCTGDIPLCNCNRPCPNGDANCGNDWSNAVYEIVKEKAPSNAPVSFAPSRVPISSTVLPTTVPVAPTTTPTKTVAPSTPTSYPSVAPTNTPSVRPTTLKPSPKPSRSPSSMPSLAPTILLDPRFNSVGCYGDAQIIRAFDKTYGNKNSVAECYTATYIDGYSYFGLQYGGECWGGNSLTLVTRYNLCGPRCTGDSQYCTCTMPCKNGDTNCGGGYANMIYKIITPKTMAPTSAPTMGNSKAPSFLPTTATPSVLPTTASPTITYRPTLYPTKMPSVAPTSAPVVTLFKNNYTSSTIRSVVYVGDERGIMHCVDANTGVPIWTANIGYVKNPYCGDLPGQFWGSTGTPVFNRTVNSIYVVSNGTFWALSMKTGVALWTVPNFYNPILLHNYGGLTEFRGIVYFTLGAMCDVGKYRGGVYAMSTITKSIVNYFSPSSPNPNQVDLSTFGGGIWGLGGVTIGGGTGSSDPSVYFPVGNCMGNVPENARYCESVIKTDLNLKLLAQNKPPASVIIGDNDYGSSAAVFNTVSDGQSSGCKQTLIAALRKDALFTVSNADTLATIQTIQIGARNKPSGIQQAVFDPVTNLLLISNQNGGIGTPYAGIYPTGMVAMKLNSTCGLNPQWAWTGLSNSFITVSGKPGERVAISTSGYGGVALDLQTGEKLFQFNFGGSAASPPAIANNTVYVGLIDPALRSAGMALEAWRPY